MNYYEEFGVRQDAPVEDIRQAYKLMTRLLHPDRQADPALRQMADLQMQRLGEIVAILTDPAKRSHYDDILLLAHRPHFSGRNGSLPALAPPGRWDNGDCVAGFALRYWSWILIGAFAIALSAWSFMRPTTVLDSELHWAASQRASASPFCDPQLVQKAHQPKPHATSGIAKVPPIRPDHRISIGAKTWIPMLSPPEPHSAPVLEDIPPGLISPPEASEEAQLPAQSAPPLHRESPFAGRWLYWPQPGDAIERGTYSAVYVELLLVERDGELSGDYRARYRVPDKAISPEVAFRVRGPAGSEASAQLEWVTSDHATGVAQMTLRGPNLLNVDWWTSEFGWHATLASGTAVLIRQQAH